jgi:hypothetical protein
VNFSFCKHCYYRHRVALLPATYFKNHKALPSFTPSYNGFIRRILEHSIIWRVSKLAHQGNRRLQVCGVEILTCITCEPECMLMRARWLFETGKDSRSRWNCWPRTTPYLRPCPLLLCTVSLLISRDRFCVSLALRVLEESSRSRWKDNDVWALVFRPTPAVQVHYRNPQVRGAREDSGSRISRPSTTNHGNPAGDPDAAMNPMPW